MRRQLSDLDQETWARIFPYLEKAQEMPPDELKSWLDRLSTERPDIAGPLRIVIAESEQLDEEFLAQPFAFPTDESTRSGQHVGSYTIESLLGRGGMGEVWLAQRSDGHFKGLFAIKFLGMTQQAGASDRFQREGRLLARLTHPNIARLIDAGVMPDSQSYLVLEYVKGEHIDQYCASQHLSQEARVKLFLNVLSAVAHAHNRLVVHRDIKPSNVLVTSEGEVKLLDFGVAKLIGGEIGEEGGTQPTRIEDVALTPDFAAPEQILGEPPSTATDVYQLGVLLFLLLAGRLPVNSSTATRRERVRAALDTVPMRLSDAVEGPARRALRGDLDAIVAKSLRKSPDERYAGAAEFAADLRRYLNSEPVAARDGALAYRARKFVSRYRALVSVSAAAALALIATTTFALIQLREAQVQRDSSRFNEKLATAQSEFLSQVMSTVASDGKPATADQILDDAMVALDHQYSDDQAARANMLLVMASLYSDSRNVEKASAALLKAETVAVKLENFSLVAQVECNMATMQEIMGHLDEADRRLALGQAALARQASPNLKDVKSCMDSAATVRAGQGKLQDAIEILTQALSLMEQAGDTRSSSYGSLLSHIGFYYSTVGDTKHAYEFAQREVEFAQATGRGETAYAVMAYHNLASELGRSGETQAAYQAETQTIARAKGGSRDGVVQPPYINSYGTLQSRMNMPEAGLESYDAGLAAAQRGNDLQGQVSAQIGRARVLTMLKRFDETEQALAAARMLLAGQESSLAREFAGEQLAEINLLRAKGQLSEARSHIEPMIEQVRLTSDKRHAILPAALMMATRVSIADRRFEDAERTANEALALYKKRAREPDNSADVGEALLWIATAQRGLGENDRSYETAARAAHALQSGLGLQHPLTQEAVRLSSAQQAAPVLIQQ
jgi:eukaryotic-like serine/threonine-protein kinase